MDTSPAKIFSWKKAFVVTLVVGLLVAGLSAFIQTRHIAAEAPLQQQQVAALAATTSASTSTTTEVATGSGTSYSASNLPSRLVIPSIGVNAPVESVGMHWRNNGTMGIPSNFTNVAWYNGGPMPGMPGNAVIAGHLDGVNTPEAVLYNLKDLKPGDTVEVIDQGGATMRFKVVSTKLYNYDAATTEIFIGNASKSRLNIITCAGEWDAVKKNYSQRLVVFTERVSS
jgi:sortase (surface protein transpeptidase)